MGLGGWADHQVASLDLELVEAARLEAWRQKIDGCQHLLLLGVIGTHARYRLKMSVALCPPKPNELLMAVSTLALRATFGT